MATLYTTRVMVAGGRDGRAEAEDGRLAVDLALPAEIGGSGKGTNPEQLFAAGFAACFASSMAFAAKGMGLDAGAVAVTAEVRLTRSDAGAFGVEADLTVAAPGLAPADRDRVLAEARRICAYHNAARDGIAHSVAFAA